MRKERDVTKAKAGGAPDWALETWKDLNDYLRTCDEAGAETLLAKEKARRPKPRKQFVMRIHSRINKLRADRERAELRRAS